MEIPKIDLCEHLDPIMVFEFIEKIKAYAHPDKNTQISILNCASLEPKKGNELISGCKVWLLP